MDVSTVRSIGSFFGGAMGLVGLFARLTGVFVSLNLGFCLICVILKFVVNKLVVCGFGVRPYFGIMPLVTLTPPGVQGFVFSTNFFSI